MPQRKRKDNPGKLDKRNPPLKTRLPVTGHPATVTTPQTSQPPQILPVTGHPATCTTEASHQSPSSATQVHPDQPRNQLICTFCKNNSHSIYKCPSYCIYCDTGDHSQNECPRAQRAQKMTAPIMQDTMADGNGDTGDESDNEGNGSRELTEESDHNESDTLILYRAVWNSMAALRAAKGPPSRDLDELDFLFKMFGKQYQRIHNAPITNSFKVLQEGALRYWELVNAPPPPPPPTPVIDTSTSPAPPPPPPTPVTDTSTQTTPPTPAQKPTTNSVSTNTDHSPATTYAEAATGSVKKQVVKPKEKIAPPPEESQAPPERTSPSHAKTGKSRPMQR
ncbi:hypothetical protein BGX38DRAFT_1270962 [Terfezia claveryi]|nr:hypothetical protein BGX38DRAFT_1270962 [Terfezia claveryi]